MTAEEKERWKTYDPEEQATLEATPTDPNDFVEI
jgi:hypothetical protein